MITVTHTPGPWTTEPVTLNESTAFICASNGQVIVAEVPLSPIVALHDEQERNARLIAAAPELLAALHAVDARLHKAVVEPQPNMAEQEIYAIVSRAIAKAEGSK